MRTCGRRWVQPQSPWRAHAGYEGAGTVEFIATGDAGEFFFLEMNTRLQVEHPVTELVYGVDLVEQQLRIASGEPLALRQEELVPRGHAVEARLYAEDPSAGFLPATGTVHVYREPSGPGVRVDSGIRRGTRVGTSYDPMLAKVIAHGADRATALRRLSRALATFDLVGVTTNAAFTRALLERDDVRAGEQDTGLLERVLGDLAGAPPDDLVPAAALAAAGTGPPGGALAAAARHVRRRPRLRRPGHARRARLGCRRGPLRPGRRRPRHARGHRAPLRGPRHRRGGLDRP